MPMHTDRQRNGIVQGVCVAGLLMVLGYLWASNYVASPQVHLSSATDPAHALLTCTLREYVPSDWEQKWVAQVDATYSSNTICALMKEFSDLSKDWLEGVTACKQDSATLCANHLTTRVFPKFVKDCRSASDVSLHARGRSLPPVLVEEYIEPLVGHMRHPHALQACVPPGVKAADVQDRSYLMLLGDDVSAIRARHPGRAILVDAGTNKFASSLGYLLPAYAARGILFDAIYAWEAQPANQTEYWNSVPDDVKPRLHFYNAPVTPQAGSSMNPVDWIKNMYRPGDYVVFKLDIDNDEVEGALVEQILDLEGAGEMIAEMFFEKHYTAPDMKPYFGSPATEYPAAVRLMQALRMKGVRVHYWP
jgi:hypothetical protein